MTTDNWIAIATILVGSQGLWTFAQTVWLNKHSKRTAENKLLLGLAFEAIINTAQKYIDQGEIEADEYKELNKYLFEPYRALGGNGTAARMIAEVEKLPIKKGA